MLSNLKIQAFKNRTLDLNTLVKVYKNLHNGLFSIQQKGLVIGHVKSLALDHVTFKVNKAGRERVLKDKKKNVHAFICGYVLDINAERVQCNPLTFITYNPYKADSFYYKHTSEHLTQLNKQEIAVLNIESGIALAYLYVNKKA